MIIVDTSVLIPFLAGTEFPQRDRFEYLLARGLLAIAPITVSEVLSSPKQGERTYKDLSGLKVIDLQDGFWERAGRLRARVLASGRRARLADTLIAQTCLDADVALLTRDQDFKAFADVGGLKLDAA